MVITLDERGQHFIPWEEVSLSSYGRGSASLWLQSVGTCQQCEGNIVCLMSLTYTLSVSLKMLLIQIVTKITAWELLLRSLDDSGSVKPIERPANL